MAKKLKQKSIKQKKSVTFKYKISPNYCIYPINGIYGGLNAYGEIIGSFFSERPAIPKEITFEIKKNMLGEKISEDKLDAIIRDTIFGISIKPDTARAIAKWLNYKADEYDKIIAEQMREGKKNDSKRATKKSSRKS